MKTQQVTTTHTEIGYSNNVDIIEKALRERFGFNDASHVLRAVAAHIWSNICNQGEEKRWGSEEVMLALVRCQERINAMFEQMRCCRPNCAVSYPHVKHL
jgi:hypothetical protein